MGRNNGLSLAAGLNRSRHGGGNRAARPLARGVLRLLIGDQAPTLMVSLSLNLMLLGFFVVLTSASTFDRQRAAIAAADIRSNFGGATRDESTGVARGRRAEVAQSLRQKISSVFSSVLPGTDVDSDIDNDRIDIVVPAAVLFDETTQLLRPVLPLLDRLAAVLADVPAGYRFESTISSAVHDREPALDAATRAEAIATGFMSRGVDARLISVGAANNRSPIPTVGFSFMVLDLDEDSNSPRTMARRSP
jgi:hypothetical protein